MKKYGIVIPAFNEELSIAKTLREISIYISTLREDIVIFLVDDGSTDGTYKIVKALQLQNVFVVKLESNQGYGGAIREGIKIAKKHQIDYVVIMDSDLTNPLNEVPRMFEKIEKADLIKASRFLESSNMSNVSNQRKIFSIIGNRILHILFKSEVLDVTNGFRAWKVDSYLQLPRTSNGFSSIVEEFYFAKIAGMKIGEVPSILGNRTEGQRKTSASYSIKSIWQYLRPGVFFFFQKYTKIRFKPEFKFDDK